jgi:hypothetical protein
LELEPLTALAVEPAGSERRGTRTGILALLWLVATAFFFLSLAPPTPHRAWSPPPEAEVVLGGEHYRLDAAQLDWVRAFSELHFSEGRESARALLEAELGSGLDAVFAGVRTRLPAFADWYYSLGGEYSRLGMAALAQLNLADGEYIAGKATSMLFPDTAWEAALAGLDTRMLAALQGHQQRVSAEWLAELADRLAPYRVPAPLGADPGAARRAPLELDGFIARWVAEEQQAFAGRIRMSTAAGGSAAAGAVLWRRAAARTAAASGRAVAARGASRTAARAGGYATGGLAACAATGPAAAGCALLAGAVAWVATDWALLKVEEARNRDDLLAALDAGLAQLQAQMHADVLAAYDATAREHQQRTEAAIRRNFTPAEAGR